MVIPPCWIAPLAQTRRRWIVGVPAWTGSEWRATSRLAVLRSRSNHLFPRSQELRAVVVTCVRGGGQSGAVFDAYRKTTCRLRRCFGCRIGRPGPRPFKGGRKGIGIFSTPAAETDPAGSAHREFPGNSSGAQQASAGSGTSAADHSQTCSPCSVTSGVPRAGQEQAETGTLARGTECDGHGQFHGPSLASFVLRPLGFRSVHAAVLVGVLSVTDPSPSA